MSSYKCVLFKMRQAKALINLQVLITQVEARSLKDVINAIITGTMLEIVRKVLLVSLNAIIVRNLQAILQGTALIFQNKNMPETCQTTKVNMTIGASISEDVVFHAEGFRNGIGLRDPGIIMKREVNPFFQLFSILGALEQVRADGTV